ncbi:hypothetical protein M413DRAFT_257234 [Hebeloma cylindrosporum]|uniref:Uncharacterized protein n=1 Tax=Hebeloma cylindrosporum TaxID=76867 RepID=A0A0C2XI74_HEBCY|nr:hypothetical protein M413DRAFT_257234 [Hebeloma cylindrosporum h7]
MVVSVLKHWLRPSQPYVRGYQADSILLLAYANVPILLPVCFERRKSQLTYLWTVIQVVYRKCIRV